MNTYKKFLINEGRTLLDAMKQLDKIADKNLYVVNNNDILLGSLTHGDMRRAILKGMNLDVNVKLVMNMNPKFIKTTDKKKDDKLKDLMLTYALETIPIVNSNKKIINVIYWTDVFKEKRKVEYDYKKNKVFVLAGGFGKRLEPFTKILPKPLIPIKDKPIIELIMDRFNCFGFSDFIISVYFKSEMIKLYLSDNKINGKYKNINFVEEEEPLGTIGSLSLVKKQIDDTFIITNSDVIIENNLNDVFEFHKESNNILTIVGCIKKSQMPYGILETDGNGRLKVLREKPKYQHVINTGVYIAEPSICKYIEYNKKMDMDELIKRLLENNDHVGVFPILEEQWFDIGQWAEYKKTRQLVESGF